MQTACSYPRVLSQGVQVNDSAGFCPIPQKLAGSVSLTPSPCRRVFTTARVTSESQVAVQMHIVSNLPHAVTLNECSLVPQARSVPGHACDGRWHGLDCITRFITTLFAKCRHHIAFEIRTWDLNQAKNLPTANNPLLSSSSYLTLKRKHVISPILDIC